MQGACAGRHGTSRVGGTTVGDNQVDGVDDGDDDTCAGGDLPAAAGLLRRPAMRVRSEILAALRDAGYDDILPGHLGVFQWPGPDGQRPGVLAVRNQASKQAMNHLLRQLETGGYLVRKNRPGDGRTRVVRLTERGWSVVEVIRKTVDEIENEWAAALGEPTYAELRRALIGLESLLERFPHVSSRAVS